MSALLSRVRGLLKKPPRYILARVASEISHELDRFRVPGRGRSFDADALLKEWGKRSIAELWLHLKAGPRPYFSAKLDAGEYERICPGDHARIVDAAERACRHEIDLLGSGHVALGADIDWHKDYKTGHSWPLGYFRDVDYINKGRPSDVKTVWELSRMQWLIPAGQAYLLTGDERYAAAVRDVLVQWIKANPYGCSVNWGVTMEPAMRIFTWTWLFHVFAGSKAWSDPAFQERFLTSLYLHGEFTLRFIERGDVNGNHFTADAAALVVAGAFFGGANAASVWFDSGKADLEKEILIQVFPDGVDFEASVAYHRLVAECFLHASIWGDVVGKPFSLAYRERLGAMAKFTAAYSRQDGSSPLWGDADDARVLPFGGQPINDHRYLPELIDWHLDKRKVIAVAGDATAEVFWTTGVQPSNSFDSPITQQKSQAFKDGGFYVMRNATDHVFIDCGPIGLAGRGGHGHNDLMAFEAMLDGVLLIVDCGSYVYTASFAERNHFRSTGVHNTPQIDGEEINRFVSADNLWTLHNDARPEVREWRAHSDADSIAMTHTGYMRLRNPVRPCRKITLDHDQHELAIEDSFAGASALGIRIPLQLAPGVEAQVLGAGRIQLKAKSRVFDLLWEDSSSWEHRVCASRVSPSYGQVQPATQLVWQHTGMPKDAFTVRIRPHEVSA